MISDGIESAERAAEAIPLHLAAAESWRRIGDELGPGAGVHQGGGLMLATTGHDVDVIQRKAELERSWGLDVTVIDGDDLRNLAPYLSGDVLAAAHCPAEGKANARTAAPLMCRQAQQHGAALRTGTEVIGIRRTGTGWITTMQDTQGITEVRSEAIVLAAGVWCQQLASMFDATIPVEPVALMMSATTRTERFIPHLVQHAGTRLSVKQVDDGNVLIGGGWPAILAQHPDGSVDLLGRHALDPLAMHANMRAAVGAIPAVAHLPLMRTWIGTTTIAPDQLPVVGAIPGQHGAFVATGGSVFTLGPIFAELLAELISGRQPRLDLTAYAPGRFDRRSALVKERHG